MGDGGWARPRFRQVPWKQRVLAKRWDRLDKTSLFCQSVTDRQIKVFKVSGDRLIPRPVAYADWISAAIHPRNLSYTTNMCLIRIELEKHEEIPRGVKLGSRLISHPPCAVRLPATNDTPNHMMTHNPQNPFLLRSGAPPSVVISTWDRYPSERQTHSVAEPGIVFVAGQPRA